MAVSKKYASSTDVARLAGVSQSAVSRTYKQGASVSPETRRKVLEAAEALQYRPSVIPRIMLTNRSNLIAVVIGGMYNPFYSTVLEAFTTRLQATGHQVLLVHVDSGHSLDAAIPRLAGYRVDAIVSALAILSPQAAADLARLKIPVVAFNTTVHNDWVATVSCDNFGAGRQAADLLIGRGGTRFAYLAGPAGSPANEERLAGFRQRLEEHNIDTLQVAGHGFRYEDGEAAARELFRSARAPDAIFGANDLLAMGAMDVMRRDRGIAVPKDVLVVGFDDIPAAGWGAYDLTTFLHDGVRMVDDALSILHAAVAAHEPVEGAAVVVPASLVERGTTRR
jgi:DNA-binding LacI/PurR family transcriptional regulator